MSTPLLRRLLSTATAAVRSPPPPLSAAALSAAKSLIRSSTADPENLVDVFLSSAHDRSFHGDRSIYSLAVRQLSSNNRPDLVHVILNHSLLDPSTPKSEGFLNRIITLYSHSKLLDKAVETFDSFPALKCKYSERSLCALLSAFLENNRIDLLKELFNTSPEKLNVLPGIASYNIYLKGLVSVNDLETARKVLDEMPDRGVDPDTSCFNTVLTGFASNKYEDGFEDVFQEMVKRGVAANVGTYNARIAMLCGKGRSREAVELLDVIVGRRMFPNRVSYRVLIEGLCGEGKVVDAMGVYKRMMSLKRSGGSGGVSSDYKIYVVLLKGLVEKGMFQDAAEMCGECLAKKWAPPFEIVRGLIDGLVKNDQGGLAKEIVAKVRKAVKGDALAAWEKVEGELSL